MVLALLAVPAHGLELDGRLGRWRAGGYVEGYAVVRENGASPQQRPAGIVDLTVTGDPHPKARFFFDVRTTFGGTPEHASGLGIYNLRDAFQNISPAVEIEETYVDLFLPSLDLRLGKQKFAWGKLDTFQPTDVVNPIRFNDPFVMEETDAKIGIPALRASYYPPSLGRAWPSDVSLTLIWVPMPVPERFPLEDERWFPSATNVQAQEFPPGSLIPDTTVRILPNLRTVNNPPARQLDEGSVGLRTAGLYRGADWSLYFYNGNETAPAFDFLPTLLSPLGGSPGVLELHTDAALTQRSGRMRLVGADASLSVHDFSVRFEGAYGHDRLLPGSVQELTSPDNVARQLVAQFGSLAEAQRQIFSRLAAGQNIPVPLGDLFVARDTVEWGLGVDYLYRGWVPLLQVNQLIVLNNSTELLVSDVDTRLLGIVRKHFLADRLETQVGVIQGLARGYTAGTARFTYAITDALRVRLGYLLIAGSRRSTVGQYHDNDEAFFQLRYSY